MTTRPERAWIGLGSNLDGPVEQVRAGLDGLAALPRTNLDRASTLYRNPPMGPPDQPDYVNAVAELTTGLTARELMYELQAIEAGRGRERSGAQWGPRPLDLDLLVYGEHRIAEPDLVVPHPGVPERVFVLYPLAELAPDLEIPGYGRARALASQLPSNALEAVPAAPSPNS